MKSYLAAVMLLSLAAWPAHAQSIDEIRKRGEIVVGVKVDSPPWGTLDPAGKPAGFEVDLANEIAAKLGVRPNITVVTSSNRIEYLRQGRIDMILATMSDTEERRKVVAMINPHYFADSTNVLLAHDAGVKDWAELKGKTLCGVQGSLYNRRVAETYGASITAFAGVTEALAALQAGNCVGFIYADQILREQAGAKAIKDKFALSLSPIDEIPWAMAVKQETKGGDLDKFLSTTIADWHRTGYLLKVAEKHGLAENPFLRRMAGK